MTLTTIHCVHNGNSARDNEFNSYVLFLNLDKFQYLFAHTSLGFFYPLTSVGDMREDGRPPFGLKSSGVYPTNSQSVPSAIMGFKYVKSLLQYGVHLGPQLES